MIVNGNLKFHTAGAGELQNAVMERLDGAPSGVAGQLYYDTGVTTPANKGYWQHNGTTWVKFATGGDASALQTEVDAIETSLGAAVSASGVFQASAFSGFNNVTAPSSITNVLSQLDAAIESKDAFSELNDVDVAGVANGQVAMYNSATSKWEDHTLVLADIPEITVTAAELNLIDGLTATAAELNILDGATLTTTELNYVDGVTSGIQGQLDNKQPLDTGLTALATGGTGAVSMDGDTVVFRTLTAPAAGITVTNGNGVAGNPTIALANDLAALEGLTTNGYVVRTGDGTATTRSITEVSGRTVVLNGSGVSSDTSIDLATVTDGGTGTFLKITRDSYGRVSGTTAVVTSDITGLVDATYVNVTGDSMTGNLAMGSNTVTGLASPVGATDAATKGYVDSLTGGLSWQAPVDSVGATNPATATTGDRFLNTTDDKIYIATATNTWDAGTTPADGWALFDMTDETGYVFNGTAWVQFTGTGQITAGIGLAKSGNVIDVNLGAGIAQLPSDEVGIDLYSSSASALILTENGTTRGTGTAAALALLLKSAGGLTQDVDGLYVPANGITNAMILNDSFTINADTGTDAFALGDTLQIMGTSTQGIITSVSESPAGTSTFTLTMSNASDVQKGVASFASADFTVTAGNVVIKAGGVDNAQLANSTITVSDGTTTDAVALGETLVFAGGDGITTTVTGNNVAIAVDMADIVLDDIADVTITTAASNDLLSWNGTAWVNVTRAAVVGSTNLEDLNDVVETSVADGHALINDGTNWVNQKIFHTEAKTSAATWVVTHNLGQKFCNVTVVDGSDEVIIPQSIKFDSTTQLTVTFNTAIAGQVVVMGIA